MTVYGTGPAERRFDQLPTPAAARHMALAVARTPTYSRARARTRRAVSVLLAVAVLAGPEVGPLPALVMVIVLMCVLADVARADQMHAEPLVPIIEAVMLVFGPAAGALVIGNAVSRQARTPGEPGSPGRAGLAAAVLIELTDGKLRDCRGGHTPGCSHRRRPLPDGYVAPAELGTVLS